MRMWRYQFIWISLSILLSHNLARANEKAALNWVQTEFQPSSLNQTQQMREMLWFIQAAEKLKQRGLQKIRVVSEIIPTHEYESRVLTKAFTDITGIAVEHQLLSEGELVDRLALAMQRGQSDYDAWVSDSDLIGTHFRYGVIESLSDYIKQAGKTYTNPDLDLKDFIGLSFTTAPDGKLYQLPDQQFANLYWFRADWFARPDLQQRFKKIYGYDLGVPLNWSAYEDIAEFFSKHVVELDGKRVYGHMDYGKNDPSLGWRFTDAWLSMAGAADKGLPNGLPVDEWGLRVAADKCTVVGASVERGGATNSPAAVYALSKYLEWLKTYAPSEARQMNFNQAGPVPGQGQIAQQIFWYTAFTANLLASDLPVVDAQGKPKWRMAPSPYGAYWKLGMQNGYQDVGAWTLFKSGDELAKAGAWLYAQFVTAKTVSLRKSIVGLTFIRESDLRHRYFSEHADRYGGLIEFYRSPARYAWTPTGTNVPDYPALAKLWWPNIAAALDGKLSPQKAMDQLALQMEHALAGMAAKGISTCPPKLNPPGQSKKFLSNKGAPWQKLTQEKPPGETISYEKLLQAWREGRVR